FTSTDLPLYVKAVLRAMTKLPEIRERSVVRFSVIPSAKYSWSGSRERFSNGSTMTDSRGVLRAGGAGALASGGCTEAIGQPPRDQVHQPTIAMAIAAAAMVAAMTTGRRARPSLAETDGAGEGAVAATACALIA